MHSFSVQFSSVAQLCLTLCDPMNCSTPGLPVHHHLPEFTQTHVHRVSDAIQPSHPRSSLSPPALKSLPASESFPMSQLFSWGGILFNGWVIFYCVYVPQLFIHSSADGHLDCFHVLAIKISAVMNNGVHVSLSILRPGCFSREIEGISIDLTVSF